MVIPYQYWSGLWKQSVAALSELSKLLGELQRLARRRRHNVPMTLAELDEGLVRLKRGALGLDYWDAALLKELPLEAKLALLELLRAIEAQAACLCRRLVR